MDVGVQTFAMAYIVYSEYDVDGKMRWYGKGMATCLHELRK